MSEVYVISAAELSQLKPFFAFMILAAILLTLTCYFSCHKDRKSFKSYVLHNIKKESSVTIENIPYRQEDFEDHPDKILDNEAKMHLCLLLLLGVILVFFIEYIVPLANDIAIKAMVWFFIAMIAICIINIARKIFIEMKS